MATIEATSQRYTEAEVQDFVHTGPETLGGRFLRRFWQPAQRSEDLIAGRAKPVRIAGEDFTLYRGESGVAHAVAFRCAHRGTQLSTGWVEGDQLRCFYHGWVYDGEGQCVEQPAEPEPFCQRIRIRSYPTQEYLGLVFVYLGEGEASELPRFPEMEDDVDTVRDAYTYTWPCNVFNVLENDPFHGAWVHRESYIAAGRTGIPTVTCEETEYGYVYHAKLPAGATLWSESEGHFHMPNSGYSTRTAPELGGEAWREALTWRVPVDDDRMVTFGVNLTHISGEARERYLVKQKERDERMARLSPVTVEGEAVLRGDYPLQDVPDRTTDSGRLFNMQDYVSQVGQGRIPDRSAWHMGREDITLNMLRALWTREMRALAEGRPLKQWGRTRRLSVGRARG